MAPETRDQTIAVAASQPYLPPLVISIHGIRTRGEWQKIFASAISGSTIRTESFDFGTYGLGRFITPGFNARLVDRFYNWYASAVKTCPTVDLDRFDKRPCAVAHSLGSWILGNALLKFDDVRFDKIILAGSILPRDFDWSCIFARDQVASLRNECGQKDPWPGWASHLVARTGTGGTQGFDWLGSTIDNVQCDWFGHSDALMRPHIERYWIPFLTRSPSPLGLLHGRNIQDREEFTKLLDHSGTVIDYQAFGDLSFYSKAAMPRGLSATWIKINPDIYTFLIDRQTKVAAGYINAMPVTDELYDGIRSGRITDNQVDADDILPYVPGASVKMYLMSIATDERYRRWGEGIFQQAYLQLLNGFLDKLTYYAKLHRIRVTHFLATAWTTEGKRMCESFGMQELGKDQFGDRIFELDLQSCTAEAKARTLPGLKRLLRTYKEMDPQR